MKLGTKNERLTRPQFIFKTSFRNRKFVQTRNSNQSSKIIMAIIIISLIIIIITYAHTISITTFQNHLLLSRVLASILDKNVNNFGTLLYFWYAQRWLTKWFFSLCITNAPWYMYSRDFSSNTNALLLFSYCTFSCSKISSNFFPTAIPHFLNSSPACRNE